MSGPNPGARMAQRRPTHLHGLQRQHPDAPRGDECGHATLPATLRQPFVVLQQTYGRCNRPGAWPLPKSLCVNTPPPPSPPARLPVQARSQVASLLNASDKANIVFTSGATERSSVRGRDWGRESEASVHGCRSALFCCALSINWLVKGAAKAQKKRGLGHHIITTIIEHVATLKV